MRFFSKMMLIAMSGVCGLLAGCAGPSRPIYNHTTLKGLSSTYFYQSHAPLSMKQKPYVVLAVDGGGVAGAIPANVMAYLEKQTHRPISHLFDLMVGTSSGALSLTTLSVPGPDGKPLYTAEQLNRFYFQYTKEILSTSFARKVVTGYGVFDPLFKNKPRIKFIGIAYGQTQLSQALTHLVINEYSLSLQRLYSFDSLRAKRNPDENFYMRDSVLAAISTPALFSPAYYCNVPHTFCDRGIDAGFIENTPLIQAYLLAKTLNPHRPLIIVSLGTGVSNDLITVKQMERNVEGWGLWHAPTYVDVMLTGNNALFDSSMRRMAHLQDSHVYAYYRFNVTFNKDISEFGTDRKNLMRIREGADRLVVENKQQLDQLSRLLLAVKK